MNYLKSGIEGIIKTVVFILFVSLMQTAFAGEDIVSAIPLIRKHSHFYLDASVNGTKGIFLLDTGANIGMLDLEFAKKAGVGFMFDESDTISMSVSTMGIKSGMISIWVSTFTIGKVELHNQAMIWSEADNIRENAIKYDGMAADGLISLRNLQRQLFALDYRNKKLVFLKRIIPSSKSTVLKMDKECLRKAGTCLNLTRNGVTDTVKLDSGASNFFVPLKLANRWDICKSTPTRVTEWNGVVGKEYMFEKFGFDELKLGRVTFFVPDSDIDDNGTIQGGLIGNKVLEDFGVIIYNMPAAELILGGELH